VVHYFTLTVTMNDTCVTPKQPTQGTKAIM
jgi:hypothetical protein